MKRLFFVTTVFIFVLVLGNAFAEDHPVRVTNFYMAYDECGNYSSEHSFTTEFYYGDLEGASRYDQIYYYHYVRVIPAENNPNVLIYQDYFEFGWTVYQIVEDLWTLDGESWAPQEMIDAWFDWFDNDE